MKKSLELFYIPKDPIYSIVVRQKMHEIATLKKTDISGHVMFPTLLEGKATETNRRIKECMNRAAYIVIPNNTNSKKFGWLKTYVSYAKKAGIEIVEVDIKSICAEVDRMLGRTEIISPNEVRIKLGYNPSEDPSANERG